VAVDWWSLDRVAVAGTVAPGGSYTFSGTLTGPAVSTFLYATPVTPSAPALDSTLPCHWVLAQDDLGPLEGLAAGGSLAVSRFPDTLPGTDGGWARFFIDELAGAVPTIVQGYQDGTYGPSLPVTRDQIAVYIARATGLDQSNPTGAVFSDIPATYWAAGAVEACAAASIVSGFSDHTYHPTLPIAREGMCKLIANGRHYVQPTFAIASSVSEPPFPDVPVENVFAPYVAACKAASIVQGYTDGSFQPSRGVTRDQLAVFVWRAFLRDRTATILLGGPAFGLKAPTTAEPVVGQPAAVTVGTSLQAFVLFDAVRTTGTPIAISFDLRRQLGPDAFSLAGTFDASLSEPMVTAAHATALRTGHPYLSAVAAIATTGLEPGTYFLVTTVNGTELPRRAWVEVKAP
jgi:hypothetical protein